MRDRMVPKVGFSVWNEERANGTLIIFTGDGRRLANRRREVFLELVTVDFRRSMAAKTLHF